MSFEGMLESVISNAWEVARIQQLLKKQRLGNEAVFAMSGTLQVKTSVGLQTSDGFAATGRFPEPSGATLTFFVPWKIEG